MDIVATGRGAEVIETGQPTTCGNGHDLAGNILISYGEHPAGGRARTWTCKTCWHVTYNQPSAGGGAVALGR